MYYDSTAGACAACGLLEIASFVPEHEKRLYEEGAYRILRAMEENFANWNPEEDAILEMGKAAYHSDAGQGSDYLRRLFLHRSDPAPASQTASSGSIFIKRRAMRADRRDYGKQYKKKYGWIPCYTS